jgi:hypothetical protein
MIVSGNLTVYKAGLMLDGLQIGGVVVPKNGFLYVTGNATFGAPLPPPSVTIVSWNDSQIVCTIPQRPDLETVTVTKNTVKSNGVVVTPEVGALMVTASATEGGVISPLSTVLVEPGADQNFNIVPSSGYHIQDVIADGQSVGVKSSYQFLNVTKPHTIRAKFDTNTHPPVIGVVLPKRVESGKYLVIQGTDFGKEDASSKVLLSGNPCARSGIWTDHIITRKVPQLPAGTYPLVVQTKDGSSAPVSIEIFERPAIDPSGSSSIKPGQILTINGSGFGKKDDKSRVRLVALNGRFDKNIQNSTLWTNTKIICTVPSLPGPGTYRLYVYTQDGIATRDYTYRNLK